MYTIHSNISLQNTNEMSVLACMTHNNSDFYLVPAGTGDLSINEGLNVLLLTAQEIWM
jgi:hypothetical protein